MPYDEPPKSESIFPESGDSRPSDPPAETAHETIAGYKIIRRLGAGGMGVVYEAEQQNPRRRVALKVIRGGTSVAEHHIKLFQREAQALALLKHPNIAAIHDAGQTEDGQHYFAMELVPGVPLNEHLRDPDGKGPTTRQTIRERLILFLQLCRAIAYAHQRSVIHRDLKPSNILVVTDKEAEADKNSGASAQASFTGATGAQIKVLDFGLARLTDADVSMTTMVSEVGKIKGTLSYMSPEQARGNPDEIDLRSDVYSLGVILYELLTGQRPYDVRKTMIHEAVRVICEDEPAKPSGVFKLLRGDLEIIMLMALEKNPADRYQSVLALAEDIERHLSNQPILASPPTAIYQFRKMVSRHRGPFIFVGTLFILSIVFGVTMSVLFSQQRVERARAEAEAQKSDQISSFLRDMLGSVKFSNMGKDVTVREVLDEAAVTVEEGLADQPEVRAAVQTTIGDTYLALGLPNEAKLPVEKALSTQYELWGEEHPDVAANLFTLADILYSTGNPDSAEFLARHVIDIERKLYGGEHPSMALHMSYLAGLLNSAGNYPESDSLHRASIAMQRKLLGDEHLDLATSLESYSIYLSEQGQLDLAIENIQEAIEIHRINKGPEDPGSPSNLINLAHFLNVQGRSAEAEPVAREAIAIWRRKIGEEHQAFPALLNILGGVLSNQNKLRESEEVFQTALSRRIELHGENSTAVAGSQTNLAKLLFKMGKFQEAEELYYKAEDTFREHHGDEHVFIASVSSNISLVLKAQGKLADGERYLREAVRLNEKLFGMGATRTAFTKMELAVYSIDRGETDGLKPMLRGIIDSLRASLPDDSWVPHLAENILGSCLAAQGRHAEADSLFMSSHAPLMESNLELARKADALDRMVRHYRAWGNPAEAARYQAEIQALGN